MPEAEQVKEIIAEELVRNCWACSITIDTTMQLLKAHNCSHSKLDILEIWIALDESQESGIR